MKDLKIIIGTLILTGGITSCSSAYYAANSNTYDDLYATHDKTIIARKQQAAAEARKAEAQARLAEWEAKLAEAQAQAAQDAYEDEDLVADSYESAYARRLQGFRSPSYRMPSSYYELRYTNASQLDFALSYNPDFYNVMVSGDQVWVEPKYITSMFGSWGASPYRNNWYIGYGYTPSYAWWGYPRYSWWDWNWSVCYNPWYNPCWGHHYPHYPGWNGGVHRPSPHSNIVRRPSFTSPSSGRNFGQGSPSGTSYNRGNTNFGVRGSQGNRGTSGSPSYQRGNSGSSLNNSGTRNNRGGTTSFNRGENSSGNSSYNRNNNNSGNSSQNRNNNSNNSSFNRGSSSSSYGGSSSGSYGGSHSSGGSVSGRNAGGR